MSTTEKSVKDGCVKGRLSAEQCGQLMIRTNGIWRRIESGALPFDRVLAELQAVAEGRVEIKYIIDLGADPLIPGGYDLVEHRRGGHFRWDETKVELFLSEEQKNGNSVSGRVVQERLHDKRTMNACVLDYLLEHKFLIPENWKKKKVFFWGTVYRDSQGFACSRYLFWNCSRWEWNSHWLGYDWGEDSPALVKH